MDEDLGFDSGFDDMGSSDIDIDSGFDDASLDTDFSVDDIGTDDIVSDEFSEMDSSMDAGEAFDSFDDTGSADLDLEPVENVDSAETDVGLELPEESFDLNVETDPSVNEGNLALDDFDENDSFDTDDTTSLTELDSEDFDSSDEAENITDDTEDDLISETEDDGYFDSIPNEMEPYVMDEAQSETDADSAETFTEVEEESPEDFEIGFETDALEETDLPNDTESNELPSAEIDNDTPDGDLTVEEADVPEGDKTPYEEMRDYMYEHNYSQMDYPEYSQDPEWQALNEQYTASLEETPATDELAGEDLEQAEAEATDTVITEDMAVDTAEVIPETASESTGDMPELTETEDMFDDAWDEDITEAVETTETPDIEELHELTDDECNEIYEPWDGERLSESFDDIDIAADPERLDSTLNDFVESNWENLSLDEQKQSMQSLADCVVDTIGLKNPPAIEFYNNPSECDYGGYDSSTNTLSVNEYMLYNSNEAADTIAHELWHAHQHECAMDPQSTRDLQYQFNFDNYIPSEDGMEDYQAQLIEAEAKAFAEQFKDRLAQLRGRI